VKNSSRTEEKHSIRATSVQGCALHNQYSMTNFIEKMKHDKEILPEQLKTKLFKLHGTFHAG
jgi:hypothetical protein